jgi:hypothetical protein
MLDVGTPNEMSLFDVHHLVQQQDWHGMSHFLFCSVFMRVGLFISFLVKVMFFFFAKHHLRLTLDIALIIK